MVILKNSILKYYPEASFWPAGNIILVEDIYGSHIEKWDDSLGKMPTQEDMAAVELDVIKDIQKETISNARFIEETSGILIDNIVYPTDRISRSEMTAIYTQLQIGNISTINWKVDSTTWITLDTNKFSIIYNAICKHVQTCYTKELDLCNKIDEATSVDAIKIIIW